METPVETHEERMQRFQREAEEQRAAVTAAIARFYQLPSTLSVEQQADSGISYNFGRPRSHVAPTTLSNLPQSQGTLVDTEISPKEPPKKRIRFAVLKGSELTPQVPATDTEDDTVSRFFKSFKKTAEVAPPRMEVDTVFPQESNKKKTNLGVLRRHKDSEVGVLRHEATPSRPKDDSSLQKRRLNLSKLRTGTQHSRLNLLSKEADTVPQTQPLIELLSQRMDENSEENKKRLARERKQQWRARLTYEQKKRIREADNLAHFLSRAAATDQEVAARREANTISQILIRAAETDVEAEARRQRDNFSHLLSRATETDEETEARRQRDNFSHFLGRATETDQEAEARRQRDNFSHLLSRATETDEEAEARRQRDNFSHFLGRATETDQEAEARRQRDNFSHFLGRATETDQEAEARRQRDNFSHFLGRATETDQEAEARRQRDNFSHLLSRATETDEEAEARRQRDNFSHFLGRATETDQEAEARRQRDNFSHFLGRATETDQEAEARRQRDNFSHFLGRATETDQEAEARRQRDNFSHLLSRATETDEEAEARREANASSQSLRRATESREETEVRRIADAALHAQEHEQEINEIRSQVLQQSQRGVEHFDESIVVPHDCGPMNSICQFCGSRNFAAERPRDGKFKSCCHKGKVRLYRNPLGYPSFLQSMLSNTADPNYRNFRQHIRSYNSTVSFASMGAKYTQVPGQGPYVFQVQGQIYHRTSHLMGDSDTRQYAQLYVLDSTQAVDRRMQHPANQNCRRQIFDQIDRFFRANNLLAKTYRMMREVQEAEEIKAQQEGRAVPIVTLEFTRDRQEVLDERRYNEPTANEIAMVFVDDDGEPPFERDIRVYPRNPQNPNHQFIDLNILSPNLDPMTYAILFPYGEPGWQRGWYCTGYDNVRHSITMLQYKVAHTAIRDYFNPVMTAGNLTQQWIVDSYLQVEANNLNWVRFNQTVYRAELYQGLADHVANVAAAAGRPAGRPIILPSTFEGSPRNMRERLQDALSIFGKFGSLDLFVTFTANPNWKEITDNLRPGETPSDRPELVAKVFKLKLKALIHDLTVNGVLGRSIAYVYTIEFQKRGLPHAHILIILADEDKFRSPDRIDEVVSAEIPDPILNPRLHSIVTRFMIHGPCGGSNSGAPCMKDGGCSKNFPKDFIANTEANATGYANYRRRMGPTVVKKGKTMDNRHVVPYNKYLLLKYDAHINVEVCTSMRAVKYIYKYIYKGFDCASVTIGVDNAQLVIHDEIRNYINARYVSAPEAMWRLLEFEMHDRSHAIIRLPVHLPNQQEIRFEEGHEEEALEQARGADTKLTAWFKLNATHPAANLLLYTEIPYHYTFKYCRWNVRQQGGNKIIPRMYTVGANDRERFYLRLLLLHVRGATSYEFLRTVNGVTYPTFHLAALHRNLLSSDVEWDKCLQEASVFQMPRQMRQTFANICVFCTPTNADLLWEKYKKDMILDFLQVLNDENVATNLALHDLQFVFEQSGMSCSTFNLPEPTGSVQQVQNFQAAAEKLNADRLIPTLNSEQREAFKKIVEAIDNPSSHKLFFLNGPGGSGKTYLYNTLMSYVRGRGQTIYAFATTGIAATLMKDGTTVHSGFGIPVPTLDNSRSKIRLNSSQADALRKCSVVIIDEVTMLTKDGLRIIDLLLREIMNKRHLPFGGKVVVLGGDFRQTLPVVPRGSRVAILEACIKSSTLWRHFKELSLITNMRTVGQNSHNQWLLDIGIAALPSINGLHRNAVEIPSNMITENDIVNTIFGDNIQELSVDELSKRVILCTTNKETLEINSKIIQKLNGDMKVYCSSDSMISEDAADIQNYTDEFLNAQTPSGMPPHKLCLKKGAMVMLLRNLNRKKGLCNGTRLIVQALHEHFITCEIISESHKGEIVFISRIDITPSDNNLPFKLKRRQFPIIPAFAVTINKSQGQTYDIVGVYLNEPVFSHGQLYVALSRSRNPANIKVFIVEGRRQGRLLNDGRWFTENVVFEEVFQ